MRKLILFAALACSAWSQTATIASTIKTTGDVAWTGRISYTLTSPGTSQPLTASDGTVLAAKTITHCIGTAAGPCDVTSLAGVFLATMYRNDAITPTGTSYTVRWQPLGTTPSPAWNETWKINTGNTLISQIRQTSATIPTVVFQESMVSLSNGAIVYGAAGIGTELPLGTLGYCLTAGATAPAWAACSGGVGSGTVTSVSVVTASGVSGSVATATTTPAITLTLGAITPTSVAASGTVVGSNLSGTNTGDQTTVSGNAGTATALAANPADCAAGQYATTIAASGALTCAIIPFSDLSGSVTNAQVPNDITIDLSAAATALAANGANCSAGSFPLGVDASGASETCTALPTTISGTANQITASAATGAITLSIPTNPTFPGTTTGTFSGNLTGNVTGNVTGTSGSTTGNAATATALATARTINGTSFDGSANITVAAAAGTLTGATLAANVLASSLTSLGAIATGVWQGTAVAAGFGGTGQTAATEDAVLVANGTIFVATVLPSCSTGATDKLLYNSTTNAFSCGTDQTSGGGSGITSLEGQTGATQTFTDDTNVTIVSAADAHVITWSGALAKARQHAGTAYIDAGNVWSTGAQDMGSATSFKVPTSAGAAPTANGFLSYDSTANKYKFGANAATKTMATEDGNIATSTALAANPTDCPVGQYAYDSAANGNLTCAVVNFTELGGAATDAQIPNTITITLAATATALATARTIGNVSFDGTAAIVPETTAIIDSTDSTSFIAMFDSATGSLQAKTDAGLTYNATTGMLTATGLTGPLTGNASTASSAAILTTTRAIYGNNFDGSAALTQVIAGAFGGTNNGFFEVSGPATSLKTFTFPNASATVLTTNASVTVPQGGSGAATLTGILKGNGTSPFTAATVGTDYGTPDATAKTYTNTAYDAEGTGNVLTLPSKIWLTAAACDGTTGSLMWDTLATNKPTATCSAGTTETTMMRGVADFPDSDGDYSLQVPIMLPSDWAGAVDIKFLYRTTATSGNTVWQVATACRADGEVSDVAFNTANALTADAAKGTTNQLNEASTTGITMTGCAAGEMLRIKVIRQRTHASDTITGVISLVGVELTMRRAI